MDGNHCFIRVSNNGKSELLSHSGVVDTSNVNEIDFLPHFQVRRLEIQFFHSYVLIRLIFYKITLRMPTLVDEQKNIHIADCIFIIPLFS